MGILLSAMFAEHLHQHHQWCWTDAQAVKGKVPEGKWIWRDFDITADCLSEKVLPRNAGKVSEILIFSALILIRPFCLNALFNYTTRYCLMQIIQPHYLKSILYDHLCTCHLKIYQKKLSSKVVMFQWSIIIKNRLVGPEIGDNR